jgi:hypothetical protein
MNPNKSRRALRVSIRVRFIRLLFIGLMRCTVMTSANSMSIMKARAIWREARWTRALRNWGVYAAGILVRFKALAPYALIELVLPGGSVMALLLWLYRRRKNGVGLANLPCIDSK